MSPDKLPWALKPGLYSVQFAGVDGRGNPVIDLSSAVELDPQTRQPVAPQPPALVRSAAEIRAAKARALDLLDKLDGRGKWNTPSNHCYADPYFAQSIKDEFKCDDLSKLRKWASK